MRKTYDLSRNRGKAVEEGGWVATRSSFEALMGALGALPYKSARYALRFWFWQVLGLP